MSSELSRFSTELPAFLADAKADDTVQDLKKYVRPPYLSIVQAIGDLKKKFPEGTIVSTRNGIATEYAPKDATLVVTPVFYYKDWGIYYDKKAGKKNPCKERTLDPNHRIAQIATDWRNSERMTEDDPENKGLSLRYMETIYFVLYDHEREDIFVVAFRGGEHKTGRVLGELIARRDKPLYAGVYSMKVDTHKNKTNDEWYGFAPNNLGWVQTDEMYNKLKELFKSISSAYKEAALVVEETVDYEDSSEEAGPSPY